MIKRLFPKISFFAISLVVALVPLSLFSEENDLSSGVSLPDRSFMRGMSVNELNLLWEADLTLSGGRRGTLFTIINNDPLPLNFYPTSFVSLEVGPAFYTEHVGFSPKLILSGGALYPPDPYQDGVFFDDSIDGTFLVAVALRFSARVYEIPDVLEFWPFFQAGIGYFLDIFGEGENPILTDGGLAFPLSLGFQFAIPTRNLTGFIEFIRVGVRYDFLYGLDSTHLEVASLVPGIDVGYTFQKHSGGITLGFSF